jgi:hypothetical protein
MNAWSKTALYVALAGGLGAAVYATRPVTREVSLLSDVGKPLTPELTDPLAVKGLEVVSYDPAEARVRAFSVTFDGQRWVIPSANNYPADAADRMAAAAGAFAGLKRERIVTDNKADHAALGVLSPEDESAVATSPSGVGTRVTMRDAGGRPLVDLIVGRAEDQPASADPFSASSPRRFVREVNSDRVYVTTLEQGFSTRFIDWVQTDLLQLQTDAVVGVFIDRYNINDQTMQVSEPRRVTLTRPGTGATGGRRPWTFSTEPGGGVSRGHRLVLPAIDRMLAAMESTRLVGVRRKPANLAAVLAGATNRQEQALGLADQLSLQTRGFFLGTDGRILSSDGQMTVRCEDGVVYMIWFGNAVPEGEDAAGGGQIGGAAKAPTSTDAAGKPVPPRFVLITALFDEAVVPEVSKSFELIAAEQAAAGKPGDSPEAAALKPLQEAYAQQVKAREDKLAAGRARAASLSKRFADWYYVIDGAGLDNLRPERAALEEKLPEPEAVTLPNGVRVEPVDAPPFAVPENPAGPPGQPPAEQPTPATPPTPVPAPTPAPSTPPGSPPPG